MKGYSKEALILCVGLIIMGACIADGLTSAFQSDRIVTVKGLSEREVPADKVIWPLVYKELGNDPAEMYERLATKNRKVIDFLKEKGIAEKEICESAIQVSDRQADSYDQNNVLYRYKATSVITVTSSQVELIRKIMQSQSELMKMGIALVTEEYGTNIVKYEFTGLNKIKPDMIEESTKNARATAEKFAKDSESKLGKIRSASQGQFSIDNRDSNTPYIKRIRVVSTIEYYIED
ncbi:MAG: SIMPL domain-containing protein [Bacteroidaceae bacterium]|nr:SIMPL domain-containing protein [Bacteroidaceae bacterium]MBQ5373269.1 SIMPL domain-containing protein [Bacteroidaceae bacterium]MEE1088669.1 SIMPL domain-containing protein [Bacteroidaceae bacterium]MEE1146544.1 SIMPL domain-containing protein [Bacteroidaceae bacterium]MEE1214948.1 SIMPL domain-containing protein [Bacteroidaceae bacterium]